MLRPQDRSWRLDAATGKELWNHAGGARPRINFWESADHKDQRLVVIQGGITELTAKTGDVVMEFGQNGRVNAGPGLNAAEDRTTRILPRIPARSLVMLSSSHCRLEAQLMNPFPAMFTAMT